MSAIIVQILKDTAQILTIEPFNYILGLLLLIGVLNIIKKIGGIV